MSDIRTITLDCGMPLIVERVAGVRSAGLTWLISGGSAREPAEKEGLSAMWSELLFRGAGDLDSRAHADALDRLGASRDSDVETFFLRLSFSLLGDRVIEALPTIVDMVRRPRMDQASIEPARDLCMQSIEALRDDPHERVMLLAREKHAPPPINRSGMGRIETLKTISRDDLLQWWDRLAKPEESILAAAGDVDADALAQRLNELLSGWSGQAPSVEWSTPTTRGYHHEKDQTSQVHIAVAHDAPPEPAEQSLLERVVISALSGGMSGRLFTEVREKRGLVYAVNASYGASRDFGRVVAYAGTTPERAQQTLDVLTEQLRRINGDPSAGAGVNHSEFQRAVVGMKSRVVMSGESTGARANALAHDYFKIGRPRSLDELAQRIDAITLDQVNHYLQARDLGQITCATIGPEPLRMPDSTAAA